MSLAKLSEDAAPSKEEIYHALLRSLRRRKGFGIVFVQSSPAEAVRLIQNLQQDLPEKKIAVLQLTQPIDNLFDLIVDRPDRDNLNVLVIQGLEKSLEPYIKTGYGGDGDYYNLDTVPRILSHLNQQRENFREHFSNICFVFILPLFAIKYFIRRAPDFFDWSAGVFVFPTESEQLEDESHQFLLEGNYQEYCGLKSEERDRKILEIQELIEEPNQTPTVKAQLLIKQGNLFTASNKYEDAISSYDLALKIEPDNYIAWHNRGYAMDKLGRPQEAVASYNKAIKIKPDFDLALFDRGDALIEIGRDRDAIASYDRALFDTEFQLLTATNSSKGSSMLFFIYQMLRQFNINDVDASDILLEVYLRGRRAIESGKTIQNIAAWARKTAYNIIVLSQRRDKNTPKPLCIEEISPYIEPTSEDLNSDFEAIEVALQQLKPIDQTIIRLRFLEGLSWQEIAERLGESETIISQAALRKRAQRALNRLRSNFHSVNNGKILKVVDQV
jgi:RNA polymerase sigma factor (sigma-70 family)